MLIDLVRHLFEVPKQPTPSKHLITRKAWENKLNRVGIRKEYMNKLVMDFLVIEGFADAAEIFRMESGTGLVIDPATITARMAVKRAVLCGNLEEAIDKIIGLNLKILETHLGLLFLLQQQRLIELIRHGNVEAALEIARDDFAPLGEQDGSFYEEFERTVSLLAFEDVSNCPEGGLMDESRRLKLASDANVAILSCQNLGKEPRLDGLLKMLMWAQLKLDGTAVYPRINNLWSARLEEPQLGWAGYLKEYSSKFVGCHLLELCC